MRQRFPRPGWVEHDPEEIWQSVLTAAEGAINAAGVEPDAIGITNQRETTVLWDRASGEPVHNAIVWQDRRTAQRCAELPAELIRERTGLVPDPYFSATKLEWLLREHPPKGLAFGTVDTWLVWKLTGGRVHVTDETNASRTLLCSLETLDWDDELLALFGVPRELLPEIRPSGAHFGELERRRLLRAGARRARFAALALRRPRAGRGTHRRDDAGSSRSGCTRGRGLPDPGCPRSDDSARVAARGRRHDGQRLADAISGRRPRDPRRDGGGAGADRARRCAARAGRAEGVADGQTLRAADGERRRGAPLRRVARGAPPNAALTYRVTCPAIC